MTRKELEELKAKVKASREALPKQKTWLQIMAESTNAKFSKEARR